MGKYELESVDQGDYGWVVITKGNQKDQVVWYDDDKGEMAVLYQSKDFLPDLSAGHFLLNRSSIAKVVGSARFKDNLNDALKSLK